MRRLVLMAFAALLVLSACGRDPLGARVSEEVGVTRYAPADRVRLPEIEGGTLDGGRQAVSDSLGKVLVLNSWASWCLPCNDEAAALVSAARAFSPRGVDFVGLDVSDQAGSARKFTSTYGVTYPSIVDPAGTRLASIPGVPPGALPSTLIIDRQGRIAVRFIGAVREPELTRQLSEVLGEE